MARIDKIAAEGSTGKIYDLKLMKRFFSYTFPYKWQLLLSITLLPLISLFALIQPYIIKLAVDNNMVPKVTEGFGFLVSMYFLAVAGEVLLRFFQFYIVQSLGQKVIYNIRRDTFSHIQRLSVSYFEKNPSGSILNRVTNDAESLSEMVSSGLVSLAGDVITIAAVAVAMVLLAPDLALNAFSVIPILIVGTILIRKGMRKAYRKIRAKLAEISSFIQENVNGMKVVQLFLMEKRNQNRFEKINREHYGATLSSNFYDALLYSFVEVSAALTTAFILWFGGVREISGAVSLGILVAFIEYLGKIFVPIKDISAKFSIIQSAMAAMERIFQILDTKPDISKPATPVRIDRERAAIEFQEVRFSYGRGEVLKGISFTVEPGEKLALVGATGSGKSTIIKLLGRIYDVTDGKITINGVDVREIDLDELRKTIGIVQQNFFIFRGSIYNNISLGREDVDLAKAIKAAEMVGASRFIEKKPGNYLAEIKEKGANLSAGQKQLLSLARVLAYDPHILIMDEATSSVDAEAESLIQQGIKEVFTGRTSIIIAHRLSTVKDVDRIIVLHKGEIRETGSHEELLKKKGLYYRLYQLQYKDQEALNAA